MSRPDLVVITPSRGRPERLATMVKACAQTSADRVRVLVCVDDDDPQFEAYAAQAAAASGGYILATGKRRSLSGWTNLAAADLLAGPAVGPPRYLASLGDDHIPETQDWDLRLSAAAEQVVGYAYGDDGYQRGGLCTAWVACASVIRAVGWMMLPDCEHMYVDNATMELGRRAGRIAHVPGVKITHMHPKAGRAAWDPGYERVNAKEQFDRDRLAFDRWRESIGGGFERDLNRLIGVTNNG